MINILIADHQPLLRKGLKEVLSIYKENYLFYEAGTLKDAIKICQSKSIDIVFVELQLGIDDGLELVYSIKQENNTHTKVIILLTSISIFEFRRAKELDVDGYIQKDAPIDDILYAFNVIKRGEKYYPSKLVENTLNGARRDGLQLLTERELDVLSELRKGLTNGEISNKLFITEGTTKKHISSILNKLKLSNRVEAVIYSMSIIIIVNEQIIKSK